MKTETIFNLYEYDTNDDEIVHICITDNGEYIDWNAYFRDKTIGTDDISIDKLKNIFTLASEIVGKLENNEKVFLETKNT